MKNQEVELLLSLRDEVTAKWQMINAKVAAGTRDLVQTVKAHWVAMSASILAAYGIISRGIDFQKQFAQTETLRASFKSMLESMGKDAGEVFNRIKENSGHLIDDSDILRASNAYLSLGGDADKLGQLMLIARAKARDLGISAREAFDLLTDAVGKSRERTAKQLGLTLDLKTAEDVLAISLGKTVGQLNAHEKQQAFLNATLDAGGTAVRRQNLEMSTLSEKIQRAQAIMKNAGDTIGEYFTRAEYLALAAFNEIEVAAGEIVVAILAPFAAIEAGARKLGLTSSFIFTDLLDQAIGGVKHFAKEAENAFAIVTASPEVLAGALGQAGKDIKGSGDEAITTAGSLGRLNTELQNEIKHWESLDPKTRDAAISLGKIRDLVKQIGPLKLQLEMAQKTGPSLEDIKRQAEEVRKIHAETEKILQEAAKGTSLVLEKNAMRRIQIEKDAALRELEIETQSLLSKETGANERDAIVERSAAKRKAIETKAADDTIKEQERVRLAVQEIQDSIADIHLGMEEALALSTAANEEQRLDVEKEFALKRIEVERQVAIAKATAAGATEVEISAIQEKFNAMRAEALQASAIKLLQLTKEQMKDVKEFVIDSARNALSIVKGFADQSSQATIDSLETRKEDALAAIDEELQNFRGSEKQKETLIAKRAEVEKQYNDQIKHEKEAAFETSKAASIIEAIINTAEAVTKALAQGGFILGIPMAAVVGALGAAQIALIASQPTPKFHEGGAAFVDLPPSREVPVLVRGQETVRVTTPEQERGVQRSSAAQTVLHFHFTGAITTPQAFKEIVEEGMAELGVTDVRQYFRNHKHGIVMGTNE
ncbi:MAG: hypothetical protein WBW16_03010 [Bacteroidota bacterium]